MKILAYLIFQILILNLFSQGYPLNYTEIVKVDSTISKNTLYERARLWLNDAFRDYKEVSQIEDKESGELSVKGIIFTHYQKNAFGEPLSNYPCNIRFKVTIWVKDGRYKYEFTDYKQQCSGNAIPDYQLILTDREILQEKGYGHNIANALWKEAKEGAISRTELMIASLKIVMSKEIKKDDW